MKTAFAASFLLALPLTPAQDAAPAPALSSEIVVTDAGERILAQTLLVDASVEDVWAAYTTVEGYTAWAAPAAEIDLRVGGTYRTHYVEGATIGDAGTITLHVVNYVPNVLLTLRAELQDDWPELMKEDADKLTNAILLDRLDGERTRVRSYGIGYRDTPEYDQLMRFFLGANERLLGNLKRHLESGGD